MNKKNTSEVISNTDVEGSHLKVSESEEEFIQDYDLQHEINEELIRMGFYKEDDISKP